MSSQDSPQRQQLLTAGYCLFPNVLDRPMLDELICVTEVILADYSPEAGELFKYQGSNIGIAYQHPVFPRLFSWPKALEALAALGFDRPKWWNGFLLSKPPHAPPLYWHQDWWAWQDPCSASPVPPQVFLMYYLTDTSSENGCLRVIPGTHVRRIDLHDELPPAHTDITYHASLDTPLFRDHPEAVDVPVKAGDLVIGDARVLHAAHANKTDQRRSCLTLWYYPAFDTLSEPIRSFISRTKPVPPPVYWTWPESKLLEPLIPHYTGDVPPIEFNRVPGIHLRKS